MMKPRKLHVGLCGAGIGGVSAAIAIAQQGARVTLLEASKELTEIGAGIQMTPNVARLLQRWGVDKVIGDNLVRHEVFNIRRRDGTPIGKTDTARLERELGFPWWVVHRHHLLTGLVEVARQQGCEILTDSKVSLINYQTDDNRPHVITQSGKEFDFDILVGSDGLNSVVRKAIFPTVKPLPPTNNASYRATLPIRYLQDDPDLQSLVQSLSMDVWVGPNGYIIAYPISGGSVYNLVMSHHRPEPVLHTEEVEFQDVLDEYRDYDKRIQKVLTMLDPSDIYRWPLLQTGPLDSWASTSKNVVLLGDAAHSMVNHMAQGAATSMEDGAFLALCLGEVIRGNMSLADAIEVYEAGRIPEARMKQQISFLNGAIWTLPDGPLAESRDRCLQPELQSQWSVRSPNLYNDPTTVLEIYGYDVYKHAQDEIDDWKRGVRKSNGYRNTDREIDKRTAVERWRADRAMNWFLPDGLDWRPVKEGAMQIRTGKR